MLKITLRRRALSALAALCCCSGLLQAQSFNPLVIPDTVSGKHINLYLRNGHKKYFTGDSTTTQFYSLSPTAHSNHEMWGPTVIVNKGDSVYMHVHNMLADTTTVHWHGMHLPGEMDGGPHQPINPGTTWNPYWKMMNNAATYWFHPHLHMMSEMQLLYGMGSFMIVRDSEERALALPRTYGIDDIPLSLSDRAFSSNQISVKPYGDTMMVNGVIRPEVSVPAQVVRFRMLNGSTERSYNVGFSDSRTFYVITSDGGLLNAPVPVTKYLLSAGERIEILVNFSGQANSNLYMKAFNSSLAQTIPGGDVFPSGPFVNALARKDFNVMHIKVGAATANAITAIPAALTTVTRFNTANATVNRTVTISDSTIPGVQGATFVINHHLYNPSYFDYTVPFNSTEIWTISNSGNFSHPFHIHDVEFNIVSRNGSTPPDAEMGWKDVVLVKAGETVKFITQFADFGSLSHPYMFHCHIALHEDEGMMGQFLVRPNPAAVIPKAEILAINLYPNPASDKITLTLPAGFQAEHVSISNMLGSEVMRLTGSQTSFSVSELAAGMYAVQVTGASGEKWVQRIVKQ